MQSIVSKYIYINAGQTQAILKFKISRTVQEFIITFELYHLHIKQNQQDIYNLIEQQCQTINANNQVLEKFNNDLISSINLNYYDVEQQLPVLKFQIESLDSTNNLQRYNITLFNHMQLILNRIELIRIYNDLESFYKNYMILELCLKMVSESTDVITPMVTKICDYKDSYKISPHKKEESNLIIIPDGDMAYTDIIMPDINIEIESDDSNIDQEQIKSSQYKFIFDLCLTTSVQNILITQLMNYYLFINDNIIQIDTNEKKDMKINIPNLFANILFNKHYFESILFSLINIDVDDVKIIMVKCLKNLTKTIEPLVILSITLILYLYCLRLIYDSHTNFVLNSFNFLFNDSEIQTKVLNSQLKTYFTNFNIEYLVIDISIESLRDTQIDNQIIELSKSKQYLKNVSHEEFAKIIFNNINQNNINVLSHNILDLNNFKNIKLEMSSEIIFNSDSINNNQIIQLLLQYDFTENVQYITPGLDMFMTYMTDPDEFYSLSKQPTNIPKTVLNLFPVLKQTLSTIDNLCDNTFMYYNSLCDNISTPNDFDHLSLLYVVYQIIIPYFYTYYKIKIFNNCLI